VSFLPRGIANAIAKVSGELQRRTLAKSRDRRKLNC
jgi:hypothetical protein